jgi:micrococcal nuclease
VAGKKNNISKRNLLAAGALAVVTGAAALALPYYVGEKVTEVIDGDTFRIQNDTKVRLFGINAPEMGNCGSDEAKKALTKLILNKKVVLREPKADGFGRVLALVYQNGIPINEAMVKTGYVVYTGEGGAEKENLISTWRFIKDNNIGIFGPMCTSENPPSPKCNIKGNVDGRKRSDKTYLIPGCEQYNRVQVLFYEGDQWFCSEKEAIKAGFVKAESCK